MDVVGYVRERPGSASARTQSKEIVAWCQAGALDLLRVHADTLMDHAPGLTRCGITALLDSLYRCGVGVVVTQPNGLQHPHLDFDPAVAVTVAGLKIYVTTEKPPRRPIQIRKEPGPKSKFLTLEHKARQVKGRRDSVLRGGPRSGPVPYGYMKAADSYALHPEESRIVQLIFSLYLCKRSMKYVVEILNADGHRTRKGFLWSRAGLSWILKNPVYVGMVIYGDVRIRGQHKPIIARITFNRVQEKLQRQIKRRP